MYVNMSKLSLFCRIFRVKVVFLVVFSRGFRHFVRIFVIFRPVSSPSAICRHEPRVGRRRVAVPMYNLCISIYTSMRSIYMHSISIYNLCEAYLYLGPMRSIYIHIYIYNIRVTYNANVKCGLVVFVFFNEKNTIFAFSQVCESFTSTSITCCSM